MSFLARSAAAAVLLLLAQGGHPAAAAVAPTNRASITVTAFVESRCLFSQAPVDTARLTPTAALRAVGVSCSNGGPAAVVASRSDPVPADTHTSAENGAVIVTVIY